jgi:hypothetical protein
LFALLRSKKSYIPCREKKCVNLLMGRLFFNKSGPEHWTKVLGFLEEKNSIPGEYVSDWEQPGIGD